MTPRATATDFLGRDLIVGSVVIFARADGGRLQRAVVIEIAPPGVWVRVPERRPYTSFVKDCARVLLFPGALSRAEARVLGAHQRRRGHRHGKRAAAAGIAP